MRFVQVVKAEEGSDLATVCGRPGLPALVKLPQPVTTTLSPPIITPAGGSFTNHPDVSMSQAEGATIYFTLDGSTPSGSSTIYLGPTTLTTSTVVKAFARKPGYLDSLVATETFSISEPIDYLGALSGMSWKLPYGGGNPPIIYCSNPPDQVVTLSGAPGVTYAVTLRIRGVFEVSSYVGGTAGSNSLVRINSTPPAATNIYSLHLSAPATTLYLNNGVQHYPIDAYDYQITVNMTAGATLTLHADGQDGSELANGANVSVPVNPGDPPITVTQPYNGQFMQLDVVSIIPLL
jgi:hypothetical protein